MYTSNPSDSGYDDSVVVAAILIAVTLARLEVVIVRCVSAEDTGT